MTHRGSRVLIAMTRSIARVDKIEIKRMPHVCKRNESANRQAEIVR